ncbi:heterokaryon incompatibility protein-domain-containing protein [Pseudoneurospora amorphoporcata]|uniref:Heterokaryon incompatibility protein-domain-containing protein n=1 Tax=Pseudoneurospora amorphoporcata TaxID=241081 RepID=A0AAN6P427_9PEZI|nr:heterokaryon incompatibility protein-domain-containing protein [Pseudoneurospora amorphoporcata]
MESFRPSSSSTHQPLQLNEIRTVILHPGSLSDPVNCTLEHINFEEAPNTYVALSYSWGDPNQTLNINLNGYTYPVTLNLHSALIHLRDTKEPCRLWIDSLCINQQDLAERSAQVARMRDIYTFAHWVTVWLGDYAPHTEEDWLRAFKLMTMNRISRFPPDVLPPELDGDVKTSPTLEERRYGELMMYSLLARPWFHRMWVIQEVAVRPTTGCGDIGDKNVCFVLGRLHLPSELLSVSLLEASIGGDELYQPKRSKASSQPDPKKMNNLSYRPQKRHRLNEIEQIWKSRSNLLKDPTNEDLALLFKYPAQQLADYLSRSTRFQVTDPKDRIFALLGLLVETQTPAQLRPGYAKSVDQIYWEYTVWMLKSGVHLDMLSWRSGQLGGASPSWVPDFQTRRAIRREATAQNLEQDVSIRFLDGNRKLEIDILPIGTVSKVGARCEILTTSRRRPLWASAVGEAKASDAPLEESKRYLLECEHLVSGVAVASKFSARRRLIKHLYFSYNTYELNDNRGMCDPITCNKAHEAMLDGQQNIEEDVEMSCRQYAEMIADAFNGFTFFVCDNGEFEFCTNTSTAPEPGDLYCYFRGSTRKYLLRRRGSSDDEWLMVRDAYTAATFMSEGLRSSSDWDEKVRYTRLWEDNKDRIMKVIVC